MINWGQCSTRSQASARWAALRRTISGPVALGCLGFGCGSAVAFHDAVGFRPLCWGFCWPAMRQCPALTAVAPVMRCTNLIDAWCAG